MKIDQKRLARLANAAAKAQEKEHNDSNAPHATPQIERFEKYAKQCGYKQVIWPGLYPVCVDNNGFHHQYA